MFLLFLSKLPKPFIVALLGIANPPPTTICAKYAYSKGDLDDSSHSYSLFKVKTQFTTNGYLFEVVYYSATKKYT